MKKIERPNRSAGFTLLELVIALAILAILAAIAYPSYQQSIINGRRADGSTALLNLANRMEQYYVQNNTFVGATVATLMPSPTSPQGYYTLSITADASTYTIRATRAGAQAADTKCGDLTLTSFGVKGVTGSFAVSRCW